MLPYLGGERTPNLPDSRASLDGMTNENVGRDNILRAAVDGVAAGLAYCHEALQRQQIDPPSVTLVGGGANHLCWQHAIADATGLDVQVRGGGEHVARGAAIQIAAILRSELVAELAARWRPGVVTEVAAEHSKTREFRLGERRAMIERLKSA